MVILGSQVVSMSLIKDYVDVDKFGYEFDRIVDEIIKPIILREVEEAADVRLSGTYSNRGGIPRNYNGHIVDEDGDNIANISIGFLVMGNSLYTQYDSIHNAFYALPERCASWLNLSIGHSVHDLYSDVHVEKALRGKINLFELLNYHQQ